MQLIYFETIRDSHDNDDLHATAVADMRVLAEETDGFVQWRDRDEGLTYWGVVIFENEEAAVRWSTHPDHARIHNLAEGGLYATIRTIAFDSVRDKSYRDGGD